MQMTIQPANGGTESSSSTSSIGTRFTPAGIGKYVQHSQSERSTYIILEYFQKTTLPIISNETFPRQQGYDTYQHIIEQC